MLVRISLAMFAITATISGILYVATWTDYFDKKRLKAISINAAVVATGLLFATLLLAALLAFTG